MGLSISEHQLADLHAVVRALNEPAPCGDLRQRLGHRVLDLFGADYFASYVHDKEAGADDQAIFINMDAANIASYDAYYQHRDPITARMRSSAKAIHVNQVMDQTSLERTEFFNDFLQVDGLTYGMNFHARLPAAQGGTHLGDLRVWRSRRSGNFDRTDVHMLQIVGELFSERATRDLRSRQATLPVDPRFIERHALTPRETDVLAELCRGRRDAEIARALAISPETVRSHLKALFQKTGCRGRTALVSAAMVSADSDLP